jgi:SAM-dependent methyltransferase
MVNPPKFYWNEQDVAALLGTCDWDGVFPLVERYIPRGGNILEAGCGLARYVRYLKDRGWSPVGVEYFQSTVDQVHRIWPDLDVYQGDCRSMAVPDASYDGALSLGVVEHFTDGPQVALRELFRIIKPGGIAIITVPCLNRIRQYKRLLWWKEVCDLPKEVYLRWVRHEARRINRRCSDFHFAVSPAYGEFFEYEMTPAEFSAEVKKAGFDIVEHRPHAVIDGIYHELNPLGLLIKFRRYQFEPTVLAHWMNEWLSRRPFFHCHMQAIVGRRPSG